MSDIGWVMVAVIGLVIGCGLGWLLRSRFKPSRSSSDLEFLNSLSQIVFEADLNGRLLFVNLPAFEIFGYSPAEFERGVTIFEIVAPEDHPSLRENIKLLQGGARAGHQYTAITKAGRHFPILVFSSLVIKNGSPNTFRGMLFDVTETKAAMSDLRQANEWLQVMLDTAPVAIFDIDREGRIGKFWNRAAEQILGWSAEEVRGKPLPAVPVENLPEYYAFIAQNLNGQTVQGVDVRRIRKDGSPIDYSIYSAPTYNENSEITGNISVLVDITARKEVELALNESNKRFRAISQNAPVFFFAVDTDFKITFAEGLGLSLLNTNSAELIGQPAFEIIEDEPMIVDSFRRCLLGEEHRVEIDTATTTFDVWLSPQRDENGNIVGIIGVGTDITARRQVEKELEKRERRFRSLAQNARDMIIVLDRQGRILYQSPSVENILGYSSTELEGKTVFEMIHPEDLEEASLAFDEVVEHTNTGIPTELRLKKADGSYIFLESLATELFDDPAIEGMILTSRDITERKRSESELHRLNRALRTTSECNLALVRASEETSLLKDICNIIVQVGGYKLAWVGYVIGEGDNPVQLVAQAGDDITYLSDLVSWFNTSDALTNPLLEVTFTHWPLVYSSLPNQIDQVPLAAEAQAHGYKAILALPLFYGDENYGCLVIYADRVDAFDLNEATLLHELAHDLSFGIHTIRVRVENRIGSHLLEQSNTELARAYDATLEGWSHALELRERETAGHSHRVVDLTLAIADRLGIHKDNYVHIRRGALLHDIGKMGIPDSILLKPGPLSADEWVTMRQHPHYAYELLAGISYLAQAMDIPYAHHERWDGSGYPRGLKGDEIPLSARIFAVVDVWDALTSDRPYRPAWPDQAVKDYIKEHAGRLFDPRVVEIFLSL